MGRNAVKHLEVRCHRIGEVWGGGRRLGDNGQTRGGGGGERGAGVELGKADYVRKLREGVDMQVVQKPPAEVAATADKGGGRIHLGTRIGGGEDG